MKNWITLYLESRNIKNKILYNSTTTEKTTLTNKEHLRCQTSLKRDVNGKLQYMQSVIGLYNLVLNMHNNLTLFTTTLLE